MEQLIKVDFDTQMVSARELHESLEVHSNFTTWFGRMTEYGFTENVDYKKCFPNLESGLNGGQNKVDYQITVEMAKEICMIQRTPKGKEVRQYLIQLERAWNTPELVMARGLQASQKLLAEKEREIKGLLEYKEQAIPKVIFADAVATSKTSILVGDLAKLITQNGYEIGQKRLFDWLRNNGYLFKSGSSKNMPMQRYVEQGLFEVKESSIQNPDGSVRITKTTKITGKGQLYFINKFLGE